MSERITTKRVAELRDGGPTPCPVCYGLGSVNDRPCRSCDVTGFVWSGSWSETRDAMLDLLDARDAAARRGPTQPAPTPARGDVWQELIDAETHPALRPLMEARRELGISRYGTPLQRDNGRDNLLDLQEELLDAMAYAQAANMGDMVSYIRFLLGLLVATLRFQSATPTLRRPGDDR